MRGIASLTRPQLSASSGAFGLTLCTPSASEGQR